MKTKIKKKKIKKWKAGETRIRRARGGYGFHCSCGKYKTLKKGDKIKITKEVNGYIHEYKCPESGVWVVLEFM